MPMHNPPHPGEFITEVYLKPNGLSGRELAAKLGVAAATEEDLQWQRDIATALLAWIAERIHGELPRAKERVEHDIGSRRYRPTDVAGAALFGPTTWPVGAEDVDPRAKMLESKLPWPSSPA